MAAPQLTFAGVEMRGKTVRVMTLNGFSVRGRVIEFDPDHQNVVLDCCDAQCAVVAGSDGGVQVVTDPPHISFHSEIFIRGSSIRWIELAASSLPQQQQQ